VSIKFASFILALALGLTVPSLVQASAPSQACTSAAKSTWLKIDEARANLVKAGYSVRRMFVAKNCFEAYVVDAKGQLMELFLDPVSGRIVEQKED
jgi:hypothetical protein